MAENERNKSAGDDTARILKMVRWLLYAAFLVIGYWVLRKVALVLTPVLAALGIAYLLDPLVETMSERGMRRSVAVSLFLVGFLGAIAAFVAFATPLVAHDVARFITALPTMAETASAWINQNTGLAVPAEWTEYLKSDEASELLYAHAGPASELIGAALGGFFSLLGFLAELLLIPVFAFYFLLDWKHMLARARAIIPPRRRGDVISVVREIDGVVSGWIRGQFTVVMILSILYVISFSVIGIHLAVPVGLLVGVLTIIPFIGTFVGAAIAVAMALIEWHGVGPLIAVGAVIGVLHVLEAMVLTPKIVGKRVGLSESAALFAVVAGGKLLGLVGVLLAVPLAASVAVLLRRAMRHYEKTDFYGGGDIDTSVATARPLPASAAAVTLGAPRGDDATAPEAVDAPASDE